jgi:hypothetical protein
MQFRPQVLGDATDLAIFSHLSQWNVRIAFSGNNRRHTGIDQQTPLIKFKTSSGFH